MSFKRLESKVITLANTSTYKTTDLEINQAIKKAINEDAVLKNLLVAKDGPASSLVVESLIDGVMTAGDLGVTMYCSYRCPDHRRTGCCERRLEHHLHTGEEITAMGTIVTGFGTKGDYSTELARGADFFNQRTDITGVASVKTADNFITGGAGDDVIVLGTTLN